MTVKERLGAAVALYDAGRTDAAIAAMVALVRDPVTTTEFVHHPEFTAFIQRVGIVKLRAEIEDWHERRKV
jgi:hypothetical protein